MKRIILLGDGMADWHNEELDGKTALQYAKTPYMDLLAKNGRTGMLKTIQNGFHPGSEVANSAILGYDQTEVYEGRGPLEAASIGVDLHPDDLAIRCNLICIENGKIKNHSCGHLETEQADILIKFLQEELSKDKDIYERFGRQRFCLYTGIQYRHLLVVRGGNKHIICTPPHDVPGKEWKPLMVKPDIKKSMAASQTELSAFETAELLNLIIKKSQLLLENHPVNIKRISEGQDPANSVWFWSGGYRPDMKTLKETFPDICSGVVITAVDLIRGIGKYAGLKCIDVEGATGLYNTNYAGKAQAAIEALHSGEDFVYLHVEASDEAGHEGNAALKIKTIEDFDRLIVKPIYEAAQEMDEPIAIAILPDHPTPIRLRTHTSEPVPFVIYAPGITPDEVETYDEDSCRQGYYELLEKDEFIKALMDIA
ncbi:MAG: cofactor-independent phosphoglycerate mutase [Prevotella sp.]|nr:cofactor-independent phosphoglycerate mutase [Prevotella sp.]